MKTIENLTKTTFTLEDLKTAYEEGSENTNYDDLHGYSLDTTFEKWVLNLSEKSVSFGNPIIKKDINGNPIRKGDKFRFKFIKELNNQIELIGSFDWNADELRYEIDIYDDDEYVCLSYVGYGVMTDFELL